MSDVKPQTVEEFWQAALIRFPHLTNIDKSVVLAVWEASRISLRAEDALDVTLA